MAVREHLLNSQSPPLFVHVRKHKWNVRGKEVIHLVTQWGLTEKFGASHQITNRHVEVCVAWWPVWNSCEWMSHQNVLHKNLHTSAFQYIFNPANERCFITVTSYQQAILGDSVLSITLIFAGWFKASMKTIGIWMENG